MPTTKGYITHLLVNKDKHKNHTDNIFHFFFIRHPPFLSIDYRSLYEIGHSLYETSIKNDKGHTFSVHPLSDNLKQILFFVKAPRLRSPASTREENRPSIMEIIILKKPDRNLALYRQYVLFRRKHATNRAQLLKRSCRHRITVRVL